MRKLVGLSLNEKAMNGNSIAVEIHGRFKHQVWVTSFTSEKYHDLTIIDRPKSIAGIADFESRVEKVMAEIKVKFHAPDQVLAALNTEVNE